MSTRAGRAVFTAVGIGTLFAAGAAVPVYAQHPVERTEWTVSPIRREGQPIIPTFEGWWKNPDGTHQLCFGYKNLNSEEVLDIPLGPDNFIEPREYDGIQPTHFQTSDPQGGYQKYWCVFSVNVPPDFGTQWSAPRILTPEDKGVVWWHLRRDGHDYKVPGHLGSVNYILEELISPAREVIAPVVKFEPNGPEGRGRMGDLVHGPLRVGVGRPLTLSVSVTTPPGDSLRTSWHVGWGMHQGPGEVTFDSLRIELEKPQGDSLVERADSLIAVADSVGPSANGLRATADSLRAEAERMEALPMPTVATTTATFSRPGEYLLRVQAIDNTGSYEFHCCWTNGYVRVTVTSP